MTKQTAANLVNLKRALLKFPASITGATSSKQADADVLIRMGMAATVADDKGHLSSKLTEFGKLVLAILEGEVPIPPQFQIQQDAIQQDAFPSDAVRELILR